ncbi:MAG: hypothetical protein J6U54_11330 [Clostridiales bacterium]|nr:hypothetical protein [Clostridiales bacterium]
MRIRELIKIVTEACKEHSPELLTGFGIAGFWTTTIMAIQATPRAMKRVEEKKKELGKEKLSVTETVSVVWPFYIPAAVMGSASTVAVVGSTTKLLKTNTVLATGLAISETARKEFEEKAKEVVGEKKVNEIKEEVAKEDMRRHDIPTNSLHIVGGCGTVLCHETVTNQYFMSDHETVRKIINDLNYQLMNDMYITVNEYCDAFNIDHVPWGDDMRWDVNRRQFDPRYYADLAKDGRPCLVIDFDKDDYFNV